MWCVRISAIAALVAIHPLAAAADHKGPCPANGCGPQSWRVKIIPDKFLGCTFKDACNKHDVCYGQCSSCGKRHAERVCRTGAERRKLKEVCDSAIERDIVTSNGGSLVCRGFAAVYRAFCQRLGAAHFGVEAPAPARVASAKRELEAIADYAANGRAEIDPQRLDAVDEAVVALAKADKDAENRFTTRVENGEVRLEFGQPQPPVSAKRSFRTPEGRAVERREYLNGIDITNMRVDGRPLDLDGVIQSTPGIEPRQLERNFKYEEQP